MNKGYTIYQGNSLELFLDASSTLYEAVYHTLGINGLNTAVPTSNNFLSIINDGKTIIENLSSNDPALRLALNTLKESSLATNKNAGDGTTTSLVVQHNLLTKIAQYNESHPDSPITSEAISNVRDYLLSELTSYKLTVQSEEDLSKVITVALGGNKFTDIIKTAFTYNGLDKFTKPALIKSHDLETTVTTIDGVSLTPVDINPVVLRTFPPTLNEEFNVLIINQNISRIDQQFTALLNKIVKSPKKTILLYTEIMPSVFDQLLFNIQEGSLNLIPIKLQYPIDKMKDYLEALSAYFNAMIVDDLNPYQVAYNNPDIFGNCTGYIINKDSAILKNDNSDYDSELLPSRSSVIQVGFITFSQQEEDFRRIEDAIHSAYNALKYGYTIGGGYTLLCLAQQLVNDPFEPSEPFVDALSSVYALIKKDSTYSEEYIDYLNKNVFDSYKVTEQVILNAFTVVSQVLSTCKVLVPLSNSR